MTYQVIIAGAADRALQKLPSHIQRRITRWIDLLAGDPMRAGTKLLSGNSGLRRVHASKDYVILYTVDHGLITVVVVKVAHRRDVYRNL